MTDTHAVLDAVLAAAVRRVVGADVGPRPGQAQLAHDILSAMEGVPSNRVGDDGDAFSERGRVLGVAPTGLGKTLASLAPAFVTAVVAGERTVLSTESLSLQSQILDKDAPMFADAVEEVTGVRPVTAVLKGFSNFVCPLAAHGAAVDAVTSLGGDASDLDASSVPTHASDGVRASLARALLRQTDERLSAAAESSRGARAGRSAFGRQQAAAGTVRVGERDLDRGVAVPLIRWALSEAAGGGSGDRSTYQGDADASAWSTVSIAPSECPGASRCPMGQVCLPRKARAAAAEADVVVTNHSILAVQAAMAVPTVFGNRSLGDFDHIIVDEAHALPSVVRNGGAREVSARRLLTAVRAFGRCMDESDPRVAALVREGETLARVVDAELAASLAGEESVKFTDDSPLASDAPAVEAWCKSASKLLPAPESITDPRTQLKVTRAKARLDGFAADVSAATSASGDGPKVARWVEAGRPDSFLASKSLTGAMLNVSPVDVAPAIAANLMRAPVPPDDDGNPVLDDGGNPAMKRLSVTMMSATIPPGFARDSGIATRGVEYASPFDDAYGASMMFAPKVTDPVELESVAVRSGSRWKFSTAKHTQWAGGYIVELVTANAGHALVLSATKAAGQAYARLLAQALPPGIRVFSQWDGRDARQVVADWRADQSSVMVGTRSLMTGVDAAGETCSLVIIDRIPRDAGNVVDDARVELLMESAAMDKWSAERFVYGSDASLRLEQAGGRLIRSMSDAGLLAVLDPRLVPGSPLSYPKPTADMYLRALRRFPVRRSSLATATAFLEERARLRASPPVV